jgi:hypothetical protein
MALAGQRAGLEDQRFHGIWSTCSTGLWGRACYSFSILWPGEAFHKLGVQNADVSALPGALLQSSMSPGSRQNPWITEVRRPSCHLGFSIAFTLEMSLICIPRTTAGLNKLCVYGPGSFPVTQEPSFPPVCASRGNKNI